MLCLNVSVNGIHVCRAGVGEYGVLTAIATWARRTGPPPEGSDDWKEEELKLHVGGLSSKGPEGDGEHLRWSDRPLKPGDAITIQVIDDGIPDTPSERKPYVAQQERAREHEYYLRLKEKYESAADPGSV